MNNDGITYELTGMKEFLDALDALTDKELFAVVRSGVRKGLQNNIVKPVRAAIPYASLKKSVGIVSDKNKEELTMWGGVIMSKRPDANTPPAGAILRWLEYGTAVRTTKAGANRGAISAKSMIIPAINSGVPAVVDFLNKDFGTAIETFLSKKIKKMNK